MRLRGWRELQAARCWAGGIAAAAKQNDNQPLQMDSPAQPPRPLLLLLLEGALLLASRWLRPRSSGAAGGGSAGPRAPCPAWQAIRRRAQVPARHMGRSADCIGCLQAPAAGCWSLAVGRPGGDRCVFRIQTASDSDVGLADSSPCDAGAALPPQAEAGSLRERTDLFDLNL